MNKLLRLTLPILVICICGSAFGQNVPNNNVSIFNKLTATWCPPCGGWGWDLFDNVIATNGSNDVVYMGTYGSNTSDLTHATAQAFKASFAPSAGWPAFCVNGVNETEYVGTSINTGQTETNIQNAVSTFASQSAVAQTGWYRTISGGNMNITAKVKFFAPQNNGNYYLNAYVIEDQVVNYQEGHPTPNSASHHYVLREAVGASVWGDAVTSGSVSAGDEFPMSFTVPIDASWNMSNVTIVMILWSESGGSYTFVNANHKQSSATGLENLEETIHLGVYPNPSTDQVTLSMLSAENMDDVDITITDITGKTVANVGSVNVVANNEATLNFSADELGLTAGTYLVNFTSGNAIATEKLFIQ